MKKALPSNAKVAKDAKETVQECVSEFISFITSEYVPVRAAPPRVAQTQNLANSRATHNKGLRPPRLARGGGPCNPDARGGDGHGGRGGEARARAAGSGRCQPRPQTRAASKMHKGAILTP